MKLIFSRKGFDSSTGGFPSPILPDGRPVPLPIPHAASRLTFEDIDGGHQCDHDLGKIVADLSRDPGRARQKAHLDPDLRADARPRRPGWRPLFGQAGAAQRHLALQGVGRGDLFLFFGWFREVIIRRGHYQFARNVPSRHVLFGWLKVDRVCQAGTQAEPPGAWAADHPHFQFDLGPPNTIYAASEGAPNTHGPSGGVFSKMLPELELSAGEPHGRSTWRLPLAFMSSDEPINLSFHRNPARWRHTPNGVLLRTVGRGQEFVVDTATCRGVEQWALQLVRANAV